MNTTYEISTFKGRDDQPVTTLKIAGHYKGLGPQMCGHILALVDDPGFRAALAAVAATVNAPAETPKPAKPADKPATDAPAPADVDTRRARLRAACETLGLGTKGRMSKLRDKLIAAGHDPARVEAGEPVQADAPEPKPEPRPAKVSSVREGTGAQIIAQAETDRKAANARIAKAAEADRAGLLAEYAKACPKQAGIAKRWSAETLRRKLAELTVDESPAPCIQVPEGESAKPKAAEPTVVARRTLYDGNTRYTIECLNDGTIRGTFQAIDKAARKAG